MSLFDTPSQGDIPAQDQGRLSGGSGGSGGPSQNTDSQPGFSFGSQAPVSKSTPKQPSTETPSPASNTKAVTPGENSVTPALTVTLQKVIPIIYDLIAVGRSDDQGFRKDICDWIEKEINELMIKYRQDVGIAKSESQVRVTLKNRVRIRKELSIRLRELNEQIKALKEPGDGDLQPLEDNLNYMAREVKRLKQLNQSNKTTSDLQALKSSEKDKKTS